MNRNEFLRQLAKHLKKAPADERDALLSYYAELLDERGITEQMTLPPDIAPPRQIAYEVLRDIQLGTYAPFNEDKANSAHPGNANDAMPKKRTNVLLIVILSILALPIGLPLALALIGAAVGAFAAILGIIIALIGALVAMLILSFAWPWFLGFSVLSVLGALAGVLFSIGLILLVISASRYLGQKVIHAIRRKSKRSISV